MSTYRRNDTARFAQAVRYDGTAEGRKALEELTGYPFEAETEAAPHGGPFTQERLHTAKTSAFSWFVNPGDWVVLTEANATPRVQLWGDQDFRAAFFGPLAEPGPLGDPAKVAQPPDPLAESASRALVGFTTRELLLEILRRDGTVGLSYHPAPGGSSAPLAGPLVDERGRSTGTPLQGVEFAPHLDPGAVGGLGVQ